jgi:hypothetical protein
MSVKHATTIPQPAARYLLKWSFGNGKLAKEGIATFGIPALRAQDGFVTCPNAGTCAALCFGLQGRYLMPNVRAAKEFNLAFLRQGNGDYTHFVEAACQDIAKFPKRFRRIRVHDVGDLYEAAYFLAWCEIARRNPQIAFYAYTKMVSQYQQLFGHVPANLHFVQSVGGKQDALIDKRKPHSLIFETHADLAQSDYADATASDAPAYLGAVKVGLVYHGTIQLNDKKRRLINKKVAATLA